MKNLFGLGGVHTQPPVPATVLGSPVERRADPVAAEYADVVLTSGARLPQTTAEASYGHTSVHTLSADGERKQRMHALLAERREQQEGQLNNHLPTGARQAPKGVAFDC